MFSKLTTALWKFGFLQSYADYSKFTYHVGDIFICVFIYVHEVNKFKASLSSTFHMKDLGVLKYFLGIVVAWNSTSISLYQRKYVLEIISEAGLYGAKPISTPMEPNHKLAKSTSSPFHIPDRYRRLIGKLIYLTLTYLELSYDVHTFAQFV